MIDPTKPEAPDESQHLLVGRRNTQYTDQTKESTVTMKLSEWHKQISVPVYILVMLFAIASWIDINGLWVELPLLVNELPEAWNLPSYLVIIIQIANIGPLVYTIAHKFAPHKVKEWPAVYAIISIGSIACLLLAFFWDHTVYLFNAERSVPLIILSSLLALVDCTSSVVFLPYMIFFKPQYMTAFYIGEGLSGFVPGIVGLIQGVGSDPECHNQSILIHNETTGENYTEYNIVAIVKPPLFSIEVFFYFLFGMLCVSGIAFTLLNFTEFCQRETVQTQRSMNSYNKPVDNTDDTAEEHGPFEAISSVEKVIELDEDGEPLKGLNVWQFAFLLAVTAWVNGLTNGVLPSTQSYSSLPYSNMVYNLSVRLSTVANPLACFIALFLPTKSLAAVMTLTIVGTGFSGYQIYLAALSPIPPLLGKWTGEMLAVSTYNSTFILITV